MKYLLLLVDAEGKGTASEVLVREWREFAGEEGISVHFRPVRNDTLFHSAKAGSAVAYRILLGEGLIRSQLWVEYQVRGPPISVAGRSGELLFALALLTARYARAGGTYPTIAATGVLDIDEAQVGPECAPAVMGVERIEAKVAAAVDALAGERDGVIFYPAADRARIETWRATASVPAHIHIRPVATLDDALGFLGIELEKVYLGNPYRGLEYFDYAHRSVFFGRDGEIRELTEQLLRREAAATPGVLVEGASGSGKSSFLRAAILPALVNPGGYCAQLEKALGERPFPHSVRRAIWYPALVPSGADERAVACSIQRTWLAIPELAGSHLEQAQSFEALLQSWRATWPEERRFVWLIDQLEELFTLALSGPVIESFGRFLLALQAEGAWTLASIRADAVPQLKRHPALRAVFGSNEGHYYLPGLGPTALDEVICRPARAAGLTFGVGAGGKRLDRALREDAYRDHENALPVLQLTLHELYCRRAERELPFGAYEALGGLSGAVATVASAALRLLPPESLEATSRLFRALVTVDVSGNALRRHVPRSEIAEDPAQERLLVALVNARLCVTDQRDGQAVVALAHEALLSTWPELVAWLKEESRLLQLRELAEHDALLWQQHAQADAWLAPVSKLGVLEPLESAGVRLSEPVREFLQRSRRRVRRAATLKQAGITAAVLLAITASVAGLIALSKQRQAQYEAARALRAKEQATIEAQTARATATFLANIFNAPTPERSLGRLITARELLDAGARRLRTGLISAPEVRARLTEQVGNAYREIGEYVRAAPLLESAVIQYHALPSASPEDRAQAYTALGKLYLAIDKRAKAEEALNRAMALEAKVPPASRSATPNLIYAHIEAQAAEYRAARVMLDSADAILRNAKRRPDKETYEILLGYSELYTLEGKLQEAERYGLGALSAESRILGPDDPAAIDADLNLAMVYDNLNDSGIAIAAEYDRRAAALASRIYGEDSPVYAATLRAYARELHDLGNNKEAERLFRRVLEIRLRTLGPHHRLTAQAYGDLGVIVTYRGRWTEGMLLTKRALRIFESSEGRSSPDDAFALVEEVRILTHLGRPAEAIPIARRAMRISQRPGRTDPAMLEYESWQLGHAYLAMHRYRRGAIAVHRAIEDYERIWGDTGEQFEKMLESYAHALEGAGRYSAAAAALRRAAALRARSPIPPTAMPDPKAN